MLSILASRQKTSWLIFLIIVLMALQGTAPLSKSVLASEEPLTHTVEYGENLSRIADQYDVTVEDIMQANDLEQANLVRVGQELIIPQGTDLAVQSSDETWENKGGPYTPSKGAPVNEVPADLQEGRISIEVVNADIRDVLSALAIKMDVQILFVDEPERVSFKIQNVTPLRALELFVQSQSLSYIRDGDLIVVGQLERLQTDFYKQMVITRYNLKYISAETLQSIISSLGIPLQQISLAANPQILWIQGTPQAVYKVTKLVEEVDIDGQNATIVTHELEHVTAQYASDRLVQFGFPEIQIITQNYPEFGRNLIVVVPAHLASPVKSALASIDSTSSAVVRIRIPLAGGSNEELSRLEDQLNYAFNNRFSFEMRDGLLWVRETPDNIKVIKDMVDLISSLDSPVEEEEEEEDTEL